MHWLVEQLLPEIRWMKIESDLHYDHWERGFVCGQVMMLHHVRGMEPWEVLYVKNLYNAKRNGMCV